MKVQIVKYPRPLKSSVMVTEMIRKATINDVKDFCQVLRISITELCKKDYENKDSMSILVIWKKPIFNITKRKNHNKTLEKNIFHILPTEMYSLQELML